MIHKSAGDTAAPIPLPDTREGIHRALVFNSKVKDVDSEAGVVDVVWGAEKPLPKSVYNISYYPFDRDRDGGVGGKSHDYAWFKQNHPDWISYTCDRTTPAWEFNSDNPERYVPLDITNSAVLQYMIDQYMAPAIAKGYSAIGFDNITFQNIFHRCGVWRDGQWVQQFSGKAIGDAAYVQSLLDWAAWTHPKLKSLGADVVLNFSHDFRIPGFGALKPAFLKNVDMVLDEGGSVDIGNGTGSNSEADWLTNTHFEQELVRQGKALIVVNYIKTAHYSFNKMDTGLAMRWSLANYLLVKGQHSYIYIGTLNEAGTMPDHADFKLPVGHPTSAMYKTGDVYARDFSNAGVFVNPSTRKGTSVDLTGANYCDTDNHSIGILVMPPQSGEIVLNCKPN